jgi:rhamnosyltransferase subunit B
VTPFAHDQFDNADRLVRLGVARSIVARKYTASSATRELSKLLVDARVSQRCAEIANRLHGDDAVERTCDLILELGIAGSALGTTKEDSPRRYEDHGEKSDSSIHS